MQLFAKLHATLTVFFRATESFLSPDGNISFARRETFRRPKENPKVVTSEAFWLPKICSCHQMMVLCHFFHNFAFN